MVAGTSGRERWESFSETIKFLNLPMLQVKYPLIYSFSDSMNFKLLIFSGIPVL